MHKKLYFTLLMTISFLLSPAVWAQASLAQPVFEKANAQSRQPSAFWFGSAMLQSMQTSALYGYKQQTGSPELTDSGLGFKFGLGYELDFPSHWFTSLEVFYDHLGSFEAKGSPGDSFSYNKNITTKKTTYTFTKNQTVKVTANELGLTGKVGYAFDRIRPYFKATGGEVFASTSGGIDVNNAPTYDVGLGIAYQIGRVTPYLERDLYAGTILGVEFSF